MTIKKLGLLFVLSASSLVFTAQEPASDKIGGVEQEHVFNSPLYTFHEHDLHPEIAQAPGFIQPSTTSLYAKYNKLPVDVQHHISGYLKKIIIRIDPVTRDLIASDDLTWKLNRKQLIKNALQSWQPEDLACIKDCLRIEYWDRYVKRARNEHAMIHNSTRMARSEFLEGIFPFYQISSVLNKPCENKYPDYDLEIAKLMIACGALVNYERNMLYSSLHYALKADNVTMFRLLMQYGLTQACSEPSKMTLMHCAAESNSCNMIRYLHKKGYDLNSQQCFGKYTPLHRAYFFENHDAVTLLLELGADPKIKNEYGRPYDNDGNSFREKVSRMTFKRRSNM